MTKNLKFNIATGATARSRMWKNKQITWEAFVDRLKETVRTNETFKEFIKLDKPTQGQIKDVGGYVGGYLTNGRRKPGNLLTRQLITLAKAPGAAAGRIYMLDHIYVCPYIVRYDPGSRHPVPPAVRRHPAARGHAAAAGRGAVCLRTHPCAGPVTTKDFPAPPLYLPMTVKEV